ncbi:hypothetical protein [Desulfitobacterium hafniense]|uniref:Uncharacterized protein n=1 Tax=Desulfitobacterium hafniense (strain Y51) TaxID=138119 RepID=Q24VI6_DESHY|nr:hypothetical protein [Desulfitobacterium hafniense]BAE83956.1 hypothetical protein DSY2167 [Desulfitobacterium hafniense Y51]
MSDTTKPYSVRTSDEVKADVAALVEKTGLSQTELFSAMVSHYKANVLNSSDAEQTEDMQQLRYHLSHTETIFINLTQKLHDLKESFGERIEKEKQLHQSVIGQIEFGRQQAEAERDRAREDLAGIQAQIKELTERNAELESVNKSNRITIELLTTQNEAFEAKVGAVAEMESEIKALREQLASEQKKAEKLQAEVEHCLRSLESREQTIATMEKSHAAELTSAQKMAELQIHASTVEANNRVLEATTKIKDEYVAKIETLQERIHTLTTRVHELELLK